MAGNIAIFVPHSGCPQQCSFCNQRSISGTGEPPDGETAAKICKEALANLPQHAGQVEIAFFGGSFTAIPREYMIELLEAVQPLLSHSRVKGIRVSTRPDAIDSDRLDLLKRYGITAVELGAQSMDDLVLAMNQRGHTAQDVREASLLIRRYGFSLGLQMMTGLYGSDPDTDYSTGRSICELSPDTVRIYPTVVLAGTQLALELRKGSYSPPGVEQTILVCVKLLDLFEGYGIRVIRLGLQSAETLSAQVLGGCYHPALGELCMGERYYNRIAAQLSTTGGGEFTLRVQPRLLSQIMGQSKRNLTRLSALGYTITCRADSTVTDTPFILEPKGEKHS